MKIKDDDFFEEAALNLAPMIDVVFLLLIFFMVATTFVQHEKEMGLDLPDAETGDEALDEVDELVINLMRDGTIRLNGADYDEAGLRSALGRAAKANPETPVTIRGDKEVVLQRVVSVMDACRVAGLTDIGMMTLDG